MPVYLEVYRRRRVQYSQCSWLGTPAGVGEPLYPRTQAPMVSER